MVSGMGAPQAPCERLGSGLEHRVVALSSLGFRPRGCPNEGMLMSLYQMAWALPGTPTSRPVYSVKHSGLLKMPSPV